MEGGGGECAAVDVQAGAGAAEGRRGLVSGDGRLCGQGLDGGRRECVVWVQEIRGDKGVGV